MAGRPLGVDGHPAYGIDRQAFGRPSGLPDCRVEDDGSRTFRTVRLPRS